MSTAPNLREKIGQIHRFVDSVTISEARIDESFQRI